MKVADILIWLGGALLVVGVVLRLFPGAFSWFGNLPGDIRIEGESSTVFIPITSMIVVSLVLSVVATVVIRVLRG
ncbi:MAG TPA: DUF2905 family protein [Acidimicrobiia bacterium]